MIFRLPKWVILNKFPAFYDTESVTALEQTARVYGKVNELIESYNTWVEGVNKAIEEHVNDTDEERKIFELGLRQEFQDFINVIDLKVLDLEKYMKTNISGEIRKLWNELTETGEIQEAFNKTLERIVTIANEQTESINQFKSDINEEISNFEERVETANSTFKNETNVTLAGFSATNTEFKTTVLNDQNRFKESVNTANEQFKTDVNTTLNGYTDNMQDWTNEESEPAKQLLNKDKVLFEGNVEYGGAPVEITRDILKYSVCKVQIDDYTCLCSVNKGENECRLFGFGLMSEANSESFVMGVVNIYIGDVVETLEDGTKETHFKIINNQCSSWNISNAGVNSWDCVPVNKIIGIY